MKGTTLAIAHRWRRVWKADGWIRPFIFKYRKVLGLSLVLGVVSAVLASALMFVSGYLISASAERPLGGVFALFTPLALVQVFGIGKPFSAYFERLYSHDWVLRMTSEMRLRLYRALEGGASGWVSGRGLGNILSLLAQDIAHVQDLYLRSLFPAFVALMLWLASSIVFGFFTWWFGLGMLALLGICVLLIPLVSVLVNGARRERADKLTEQMYAHVTDDVLGVGDWICSGRKRDFLRRVRSVQDAMRANDASIARFNRRRDLCVQCVLGVATAFVALWAAWRFGGPIPPTGDYGRMADWIAAFVLGFFPLIEVFASMSDVAVRANGHVAAIERLNALRSVADDSDWIAAFVLGFFPLIEVFASMSDVAVRANGHVAAIERLNALRSVADDLTSVVERTCNDPCLNGGCAVSLNDVWFSYPQECSLILRGVTLRIQPGEKVAILGPSGAGKSTLLGLMRGDLRPGRGSVRLGGVYPNDLGKRTSRYIGLISQDVYLFNATLRENLQIACSDASDEELRAALEAVGLKGLLDRLPQGLSTMVDEAGLRFSGGERHRLALARVLLQRVPVVLLDEPTVGLDPETEAALLDTVFDVLKDKTVVMVTHHLLGIESMDRVVFLEDGRIAMEGSHRALLETNQRYRDLILFDKGIY